ncbi:MAG: hypothetical protein EWV79_00365 [Microcystis aeruginosa Ma_MB_S_20031200_S102D]|nr:MAG: hypothetical protein EWV79_00365 [Microcystis aeruginosa Ma_MB_S_20031200_S102D]
MSWAGFASDANGNDRGRFADVNGDGKQDYVYVWNNAGKRAFAVYLAKGDGTFQEHINTGSWAEFHPDANGNDRGRFADVNCPAML